jgi:hypothetical protein
MGWYNSSWLKRIKITTDNTKVSNANDVVYYDLSLLPSGFWSAVTSTGGDIRVTKDDGETEVAREVSGFDDTGEVGSLWIKTDGNLSTSTDSDFYVYFDNSSAVEPAFTDTYGRNNVWGSDTIRVWHLTSNGTNSKGSNDMTLVGTPTFTNEIVGRAMTVPSDGTQYGTIGQSNQFTSLSAGFTITAYIKSPTMTTVGKQIISNYNGGNFTTGVWYFAWSDISSGQGKIVFSMGRGSSVGYQDKTPLITLANDTIHRITTTFDGGTTRKCFVNGVEQTFTLSTGSFSTSNMFNSSVVVRVGRAVYTGDNGNPINGEIDEVKIKTSVNSTAYELTEYEAEVNTATFWTTGTIETEGAGLNTSAFFAFM